MQEQLIKDLMIKNKTALMKEIKEIKELTQNNDEIRDLFSINIILNILKEKNQSINLNALDEEDSSKQDSLIHTVLFLNIPLIKNYMFGNETKLDPYINEKLLKETIRSFNEKVPYLYDKHGFSIDYESMRKSIQNEYNINQEKTIKMLEKYDLHLILLPELAKEDIFLSKLEEEILNIKRGMQTKRRYDTSDLVVPINGLIRGYFKDILYLMQERDLKDRSEAKFIFMEEKLMEWKMEKRKDLLLEKIENNSKDSNNEMERKKPKI